MGRATVVAHLGSGRYTIKVQYDNLRIDALIEEMTKTIAYIEKEQLPKLRVQEIDLSDAFDAKKAELDAAIDAYIADQADENKQAIVDKTKASLEAAAPLQAIRAEISRLQALLLQTVKRVDLYRAYRPDPDKIHTIWCTDLSDGSTGRLLSGDVGLIDVGGDNKTYDYIIKPGSLAGEEDASPKANDGIVQHVISGTPSSVYYNLCMRPAWKTWRPRYRIGTITAKAGPVADVLLDPFFAERGITGVKPFDLNRDSSGAAITTIHDAKFEYMDCHHYAFEAGDRVVVEFFKVRGQENPAQDRVWANPTVIGFVSNPKACPIDYRPGSGPLKLTEMLHVRHGGSVSQQYLITYRDGWKAWPVADERAYKGVWYGAPDSEGRRNVVTFNTSIYDQVGGGFFINGFHALVGTGGQAGIVCACEQSDGTHVLIVGSTILGGSSELIGYKYTLVRRYFSGSEQKDILTIGGQPSLDLFMGLEQDAIVTANASGNQFLISLPDVGAGNSGYGKYDDYLITINPGETDGALTVIPNGGKTDVIYNETINCNTSRNPTFWGSSIIDGTAKYKGATYFPTMTDGMTVLFQDHSWSWNCVTDFIEESGSSYHVAGDGSLSHESIIDGFAYADTAWSIPGTDRSAAWHYDWNNIGNPDDDEAASSGTETKRDTAAQNGGITFGSVTQGVYRIAYDTGTKWVFRNYRIIGDEPPIATSTFFQNSCPGPNDPAETNQPFIPRSNPITEIIADPNKPWAMHRMDLAVTPSFAADRWGNWVMYNSGKYYFAGEGEVDDSFLASLFPGWQAGDYLIINGTCGAMENENGPV